MFSHDALTKHRLSSIRHRSSRGPRFDPGLSDFIFGNLEHWRSWTGAIGGNWGTRRVGKEEQLQSKSTAVGMRPFFIFFSTPSPHSFFLRAPSQLASRRLSEPAPGVARNSTQKSELWWSQKRSIKMTAALRSTRTSSALFASTSARSTTTATTMLPPTIFESPLSSHRACRRSCSPRFLCRAEEVNKVRMLRSG